MLKQIPSEAPSNVRGSKPGLAESQTDLRITKIDTLQSESGSQKSPPNPSQIPKAGKDIITWSAPEYIQLKKSARWYMVATAIAAVSIVLAALSDNLTLALAIIAFAAVYQYLHSHHPPKIIKIRINELGIYVGNMFFPYGHITAFWIIFKKDVKTLNLRVTKRYHSDVVIQFDAQDPVPVRNYLVEQVPEWEGKEESLSDAIFRLLKL